MGLLDIVTGLQSPFCPLLLEITTEELWLCAFLYPVVAATFQVPSVASTLQGEDTESRKHYCGLQTPEINSCAKPERFFVI